MAKHLPSLYEGMGLILSKEGGKREKESRIQLLLTSISTLYPDSIDYSGSNRYL